MPQLLLPGCGTIVSSGTGPVVAQKRVTTVAYDAACLLVQLMARLFRETNSTCG